MAGTNTLVSIARTIGTRFCVTALCVVFAFAIACDSKSSSSGGATANTSSDTAKSESSDDDAGAAKGPIFGTSVIRGTIVLEGDPPPTAKIRMQGDKFCEKHNMEHVAPKLEVGKDGGLPHVFVYIKKGISGKYPVPSEAVTLDQTGCMYNPHIFGLQIGQTLKIKNNDNTAHNVHSLPKKNQKFNISQPQAGMTAEKSFDREEVMVKFKCDVHGWMDAYCGVLKHPFFAVTDADGNFSIEKLPAGKYTIEAWHEMYPAQSMEFEVKDGESREIVITFRKSR